MEWEAIFSILFLMVGMYAISIWLSSREDFESGESIMLEDPEKYYTKEILDAIDEACKKEFLYGQDGVGFSDEEELVEEEA